MIGKSVSSRVKSVTTKRIIDIFVTRLDPGTQPEDLVTCITDIKPDLHVDDIFCTRLKSKYDLLYSSYHVAVSVDSTCFKPTIDKLMAAESWPEGLLIRRYFKPKINNGS